MAASRLTLRHQGGAGALKGLDKLVAKLSRFSDEARATIKDALDVSADELVGNIRSITPVSPAGPTAHPPGELRDSVHKEAGRHELAVIVVEDARDAEGNFYGPHVEFGHKTEAGGHVAAEPHFFPSVRVAKRKIKSRVSRAVTRAIKQTIEAGGKSA